MMKLLVAATLTICSLVGNAQTNATKNELVAKVLKLQQSSFDTISRALVEGPATQMGQQAGIALQKRIPADQQAAVGKEMQADLSKYAAATLPAVRDRALALAPSTVGKVLEEKFSESELKQLITMLESPISRKYTELGPSMQRALQEKLLPEARPLIEPKLKTLELDWAKRLGMDAAPSTVTPVTPNK